MKEITEVNYKDLEYNFDGIVIAYPKIMDFKFDSDFYFIKQRIDYATGERYYTMNGYNKKDWTGNGISFDDLETRIENAFNCFSQMNYYQFEDMKEFCNWYLYKDDRLHQTLEQFVEGTKKFYEKDWIHEKCNTNTPPSTVPKHPSKGNKLKTQDNSTLKKCSGERLLSPEEARDIFIPKMTMREKLKDVLKLLELRDTRQSTLDSLIQSTDSSMQEHLAKQLERDEKRIEEFLEEKIRIV